MSADAFEQMSIEVRRSWVATEIMGWTRGEGRAPWRVSESGEKEYDDWFWITPGNGTIKTNLTFRPDESLDDARLMEDRLEEMGLIERYGWALADIVSATHIGEPLKQWKIWRVVRASAEDRVRAAWQVIGEKKDD